MQLLQLQESGGQQDGPKSREALIEEEEQAQRSLEGAEVLDNAVEPGLRMHEIELRERVLQLPLKWEALRARLPLLGLQELQQFPAAKAFAEDKRAPRGESAHFGDPGQRKLFHAKFMKFYINIRCNIK